MITGIELIAAERDRQLGLLGYGAEHDQGHEDDALAKAGAWYALDAKTRAQIQLQNDPRFDAPNLDIWPDGVRFRGNPSRIRELQKAGALIAAEIDRLLARGDR